MKKISCMLICCFLYFVTSLGANGMANEMDSFLTTPDEHLAFIRSSLRSAKERVIIVSPYISSRALAKADSRFEDLKTCIEASRKRGIEVCVFTDNKDQNPNTVIGREVLSNLNVDLIIVSQLHSKNLIIDNDCITFGSFNWLSAVTDPASIYCNYETTTIVRNELASSAIDRVLGELEDLKVTALQGTRSFALIPYIESGSDLEAMLSIYKSTQNPYLISACANSICEHLVFCHDYDDIRLILEQTAQVHPHMFPYFIENIFETLIEDIETPKGFENLEKFFIEINKKEIAEKVRMRAK